MWEFVHKSKKMQKIQKLVDMLMDGEITKREYEKRVKQLNRKCLKVKK